jgi:rhodanese-related sulfurtransferase
MARCYRKVSIAPVFAAAAPLDTDGSFPVMEPCPMSYVTAIPAADSAAALAHFDASLRFETDCWDVHDALASGAPDFVLLDVRSPDLYAAGHLPGARSMPHRKIVATRLAAIPADTLFVVYCAGPHCNGAARAAASLARLGRPVKLMLGGVTGWLDEGFALVTGALPHAVAPD